MKRTMYSIPGALRTAGIILILLAGWLAVPAAVRAEDDEFGSADEFETCEEFDSTDEACTCDAAPGGCPQDRARTVTWVLGILAAAVAAGILVRFPATRRLRPLVLLTSLVVLGFVKGGCPCMIASLEETWLALTGTAVHWTALLWFLGLIPITYLFGRVWCGWVCHLGALQEFLYQGTGKAAFLKARGFQRSLRILQYVFLAALLIQLIVTKTKLFCCYDPFLVIFNQFSATKTGYVLAGLLLLTSLFIYRPFCRGICPVGLVLGWVGRLPGAGVVRPGAECTGCGACVRVCRTEAIRKDEKAGAIVDPGSCILCADCLSVCRKDAMVIGRNTRVGKKK